MKYNRHVLDQFAQDLTERADRLPTMRALGYGLVCAIIAGLIGSRMVPPDRTVYVRPNLPIVIHGESPAGAYAFGAFFVGGLIGFISAQGEAARLRIQAHTLLLQMQIEENTRKEAAK